METVEAAKTSPALTYVVWAQSVLHIISPELVLEMGPTRVGNHDKLCKTSPNCYVAWSKFMRHISGADRL